MTPREYLAQAHPDAQFGDLFDDICYLLQQVHAETTGEEAENGGELLPECPCHPGRIHYAIYNDDGTTAAVFDITDGELRDGFYHINTLKNVLRQ